jgi:protein-S-isoprenylcysteine O-methyltransferase Ste14
MDVGFIKNYVHGSFKNRKMKKEKGYLKKSHTHRDSLVGEYVYGDIGQLVFLIIFLMVWIADSFIFRYSTFLTRYISNFIRVPIALVIFFVSGLLAKDGLNMVFGKKREEPHMITTGAFSFVRHPIYLALILLYLGFILLSLSLLSILVWILIIIFYYMISRYEEKLLIKAFGSAYSEYMRKVPMFLPIKILKGDNG